MLRDGILMKHIVSVGQCYADGPALERAIVSRFQAQVLHVDTADQALAHLNNGGVDLVLVNRIFDANGESGIDFIRRLKSDPATRHIPVMLISNYPEYQAQAQEFGAAPGFGKNALGEPEMVAALAPFLAER
jgi:CheY-like chemotaxis protein